MTAKSDELSIIDALSKRIVEAQKNLRILDCIKWDDAVREEFFRQGAREMPPVDVEYYRQHPLPFDSVQKMEELRGIIRDAENQLGQYAAVTRLIKRQCQEYVGAVRMLDARGTALFSELSTELYGSPDDVFYAGGPKLSLMGTVLFDLLTQLDGELQSDADIKKYTPEDARSKLQTALSHYFDKHQDEVTVIVSDGMIADASAGADRIRLSQDAMFSERELRYLEVHEGWVHVGTTLNGAMQPYCSFLSKGSPSTSVLQEGLAVLTEIVTFSSFPGRMRKLINRVIALDKVSQGANFLDIYQYFLSCELSPLDSYKHSVRLFRGSTPQGGAFTRDVSYAKGFVLVYNFIRFAISQQRMDVVPLLFCGKLMLDDLPLLCELRDQSLLIAPTYLPPAFKDLSSLSVWMSVSLFLNQFEQHDIQKNFQFLLT